jgi:proline iminopeptidase
LKRYRAVIPGFLLLALCAAGGSGAAPLTPGEGFVQVPGGPVWYRVFGSGPGTPLLMLHGGPGGRSCSFEPLATLVGAHRPVVVYDQLGGGRSGRPMDRGLWTLERSLQEVEAVRSSLGLSTIHLLGASWGASLAADYALTTKSRGLRSLILSGPLLSTKIWIEDANVLRGELPQDVQDTLTRNEQAGTVHSPEYERATRVFYSHFLYHHPTLELPAGCAEAPSNQEVYEFMGGPTEFNATGTLLHFDVTAELGQLRLPVLFTAGRYDEARPETVAKFQAMVPGSRIAILEHSGHMAPLEEYQEYARLLEDFLEQAEGRVH